MANKIQLRRGKKSTFAGTKKSTVLAHGEIFVEYQDGGIGKGPCAIKIGDGTTTYENLPYTVNFNQDCEFIMGTQTASTGAWTGVSKSSVLEDGKQIAYFLPYAGSGNATLNLTLSTGTASGAKNIYRYGTTRVTTQYPANSIVRMTYVASKNGWFVDGDYDTTVDYRLRVANAIYFSEASEANTIVVGDKDGYKPCEAGATFDISYPILFTTGATAATKTATNCNLAYNGVNLQTTKSGFTGTTNSKVYLVGTLSGSTFTIDSSVFTCTVPTSVDNKIYIPIGWMYSTTNCYFYSSRELYAYYNGAFQPLSFLSTRGITNITRSGTTFTATRGDGTTFTFSQQDNNTTYDDATTSTHGLMSTSDKLKANYSNIAYGTCSTAADTAAKVITVSGNTSWALQPGAIIVVKFSATNTAQNPTFNVNNTGAKSVWYNTALITTSNLGLAGTANRPMEFMYDGTQFVFIGWSVDNNTTYTNAALGQGYGTCSTGQATVAKVVTLASYVLTVNGIVSIKFTYGSCAGATLNINSKGAKAVLDNGVAATERSWNAGDTVTFIYNGTNYIIISIDNDDFGDEG